MTKRVISLIISIALCFSALPVIADDSASVAAVETDEKTGTVLLRESFESDLKGWTLNGNTESMVSIKEGEAKDGKKALYTVDSSKEDSPSLSSAVFSAKEGESYTLSFDIKNESGSSLRMYFRFLNDSGKILYNKSYSSDKKEWANVKASVVAPKGATKGQILISGIKTALGNAYIDNIILTTTDKSVTGEKDKTEAAENDKPEAVETDEKSGTVVFKESFEEGIYDWKINDNDTDMLIVKDLETTDGKKALYVIDERKDGYPTAISKAFPAISGESYTIKADNKRESGSSFKIFVRFLDDNEKILLNKSFGEAKSEWSTIKLSLIAPEGTKKCMILIAGEKSAMSKVYVDNIVVTTTASKETLDKQESEIKKVNEIPDIKYATENDIIFKDDFENGLLPHWEIEQTSVRVEVSGEETASGKGAIAVFDDSDKERAGITTKAIPVNEGDMYSLIADVYTKRDAMRVYLRYFTSDMTLLTSSYGVGGDNEWENIFIYSSAPTNAKYLQMAIYTTTGNKEAGYVDNVKVYKGLYNIAANAKAVVPPAQKEAVDAKIVAPVDNKLVYTEYTDKGDKIGDYSYAGFYAGEYNLPITENLKVSSVLSPSGTYDDTEMIQKAVNKAASEVSGVDMRVVKLKAGRYNISSDGIDMKSGVILSGEGQGPTGTVLYAKDAKKYTVVEFAGKEPSEVGERALITDDYISSGSKTINVSPEDIKNFKVGDEILIYHPSTNEWSTAIGMMGIQRADKDTSWTAGKVEMMTERTITKIEGTEITLDFGFFVPYMKELSPSYIVKLNDSGRIKNAGIENLRLVSYYNGNPDDENHATVAVGISNAENIFARDITAKHFYMSLITSSKRAKGVTALNCSSIAPVSKIMGSRRYTFATSTSAQQVLYTGCYSFDGRHDFEASFPVTGPVSFVDNVCDSSNASSEPHGTWSTGVLYDNLYQISDSSKGWMSVNNHGQSGTSLSQGWSGAGCVVWNSLSSTILVHDVPLNYENFVVGIWGHYDSSDAAGMKKYNIAQAVKNYKRTDKETDINSHFITDDKTSVAGDAYFESIYNPVNPRSLYKAQLSERFTGVINNAKPNAPIITAPKYDEKKDDQNLLVTGIYQLGASKVTVYIDNRPYDAKLKMETNEFEVSVNLNEGTHKIYATQTIDGNEGNKTADRFIIIKNQGENKDYLQSIYSAEKTSMIINDPRPTFDKITGGIKVMVNDNLLYSDVLPYETQGRVLVPMRAIFEKFNANVSWDEKTSTATAVKDGIEVKITENSTKAYVNQKEVILDVPATILNGRFVVPVRFISESFGAEVGWIDETKTVTIKY